MLLSLSVIDIFGFIVIVITIAIILIDSSIPITSFVTSIMIILMRGHENMGEFEHESKLPKEHAISSDQIRSAQIN